MVAGMLAISACGSPPAAQGPAATDGTAAPAGEHASGASAPEARSAPSAKPAWPTGLVPCAKDAPEGEGCAAGPPKGADGKSPEAAKTAPSHSVEETVWKVPVGPNDPVRGPSDALVTVVVFSDFECPFCKRGAETLAHLAEAYPRDVRVVWKDLPLPMHEHAEPAAELARVARAGGGDAAFWSAHDLLYASQPKLDEPALQAISDKLGLKWSDVRAAIRGARFGAIIRADVVLSDRTNVEVTPTTFVNGRLVRGAQPYEAVRAIVEVELAKAQALVTGGVAKPAVYATIIQKGRQVTPPADSPPP